MERLTTILIKNMLVVALNWELKKGNNRNSTLRQKIRLFSSYITLFSTRQNSQFLSCKCYVVFDFDMKSTTIRHDAMAAQTNQRPKVCSFQYTPCRPCLFVWMMASDERIAFLTGTGYFDFLRADFIIVCDFHRSIYFRNVCNLSI